MIAVLSKVIEKGDNFSFVATINEKPKGYEFEHKKGATIARARLIKALKKDNLKVYFY